MTTLKRMIATTELLLIFPATLFMASLFLRSIQPQQYEPAQTAQRIVDWFAARQLVGLWVLLIALPLAVLITGGVMLLRSWNSDERLRQAAQTIFASARPHLATFFVVVSTLAAAGILVVVALHVLTD